MIQTVTLKVVDNGYIVEHSNEEEGTMVFQELQQVLNYLTECYYDEVPCGKSTYDYKCEIVDKNEREYVESIVVTRHKALVQLLNEEVWVSKDVPVIEHATEKDVAGKWVYGVLPLHLAAKAYAVTEVSLDIPQELRGQELTIEQINEFYKGIKTYKVRELKDE